MTTTVPEHRSPYTHDKREGAKVIVSKSDLLVVAGLATIGGIVSEQRGEMTLEYVEALGRIIETVTK